jgi:hypothetical protein
MDVENPGMASKRAGGRVGVYHVVVGREAPSIEDLHLD